MQYHFGEKGIWHRPASERTKAKDIPAMILEEVKGGLLYIFTLEKTEKNLTGRTATIFPSDFKTTSQEFCPACNADLPPNHFLKK